LRRIRGAEHFGRPGLIEADLLAGVLLVVADRLEQPQGAGGDRIGGVLGLIEADPDMRLRAEVVDLIGLDALNDVAQA
jgi:hypothetical protein